MYTQLILADGTELDVVREVEVSAIKCAVIVGTATFESLSNITSALTKSNLATVEYKTLPEDDSEPKTIRSYTDMVAEPNYSIEQKTQYIEVGIVLRKITDDERREEKFLSLINTLSDEDAVLFKTQYPTFDELSGSNVASGDKFTFNGLLYKSNKDLDSGSLAEAMAMLDETGADGEIFTCIDKVQAGTYEDPINYDKTVQLQPNRFYKQNGVVYYCIQAPKSTIDDDLFNVIDLYVREPQDVDINPPYPTGKLYQYSRDVLPWLSNINTLYDGKIWIAKDATEDVPSIDDSDDWMLYGWAKPDEQGEPLDPNLLIDNSLPTEDKPVVDDEPSIKEPETSGPVVVDTPNEDKKDESGESTDENTEENKDTTKDSTEETVSGTEETPSESTETTPDTGDDTETTPAENTENTTSSDAESSSESTDENTEESKDSVEETASTENENTEETDNNTVDSTDNTTENTTETV